VFYNPKKKGNQLEIIMLANFIGVNGTLYLFKEENM
jgi:hypothetical protein